MSEAVPPEGRAPDESVELREASELTRKACELWRKLWLEPAIREREEIARAALYAEKLDVNDGWRLDVERGVWFRNR